MKNESNKPKANGLRQILTIFGEMVCCGEGVAWYEPDRHKRSRSKAEQQIREHFKSEYAKRLLSEQNIADLIRDNLYLTDITCNQGRIKIAKAINDEQKRRLEL